MTDTDIKPVKGLSDWAAISDDTETHTHKDTRSKIIVMNSLFMNWLITNVYLFF